MLQEPCPPAVDVRPLDEPLQRRALQGEPPGYAAKLATTSFGLPSLEQWCVWIEPHPDPENRWSLRWRTNVDAALNRWGTVLPVTVVDQKNRAQIQILRRRPPRRRLSDGWRASNGRSTLQLLELDRSGVRRREPSVTVLVSPELRSEVLQATALHELGHAFGLWGHSDDASDALAVHQGTLPVLIPSPRDRSTLEWVRRQPNRFGVIPLD